MGRAAMGHPLLSSWMWWMPILFWSHSMALGQFVFPAPPPPELSLPQDTGAFDRFFYVGAIGIPSFVVVAGIVSVLCYVCKRYGRFKRSQPFAAAPAAPEVQAVPTPVHPGSLQTLMATWASRCTFFQLRALQKATENFSAHTELGSGGFGTVYKGSLEDGRVVAIKKSKHAGTRDLEQFVNEVSILSQLNHNNLVLLLGCCVEMEVPLLVYEFISNGTLQDHLREAGQGQTTELDWTRRLIIAIQTAEALKYLHVLARPPIFHRDVKSANILLDETFNAKVADFGLSRLVDNGRTHISTYVKGTPGYIDPDYFRNMQLTDKADVFSFGVVLLELITAQKPVDMSRESSNITEYCVPLIKRGRVREIIDPTLLHCLTPEDVESIQQVAQVAVACLAHKRDRRPSMTQVVAMLNRVGKSFPSPHDFYHDDTVSSEELVRVDSFRSYSRLSSSSSSKAAGSSA